MTAVTLIRAEDGSRARVRAIGHSGFAEAGSDIVCAAVSALVQTAYLAIKDLGCKTTFTRDADTGLFEFSADCGKSARDVKTILRALEVGLNDLRSGYPQYIRLETVNWEDQ